MLLMVLGRDEAVQLIDRHFDITTPSFAADPDV
jgi:hypothetical protein